MRASSSHQLDEVLNTSQTTTHFYKTKSHSGIIENKRADALALQAAKDPAKADNLLNQVEHPFSNFFWLATSVRKPNSHTEEIWTLPNLRDKRKQECMTYTD
eukprot:860465-Pelagomonas_calceolata.AAC.4